MDPVIISKPNIFFSFLLFFILLLICTFCAAVQDYIWRQQYYMCLEFDRRLSIHSYLNYFISQLWGGLLAAGSGSSLLHQHLIWSLQSIVELCDYLSTILGSGKRTKSIQWFVFFALVLEDIIILRCSHTVKLWKYLLYNKLEI